MLKVTLEAVEAILQLMQVESADGLRLHVGSRRFSRAPAIQIEAARMPNVEDAVLEVAGARLYLDPETYKLLDDKVLDADFTGDQPVVLIYEQPDRTKAPPRRGLRPDGESSA